MNDHWSGNTLLRLWRTKRVAPRRLSNQRPRRLTNIPLPQCVEVGGDVAGLLRSDAEVGHVGSGLDALRVGDPMRQVVGRVPKLARDVAAAPELLERRSDEPARTLDAGDLVTRPAPVVLDQLLADLSAATRHGADLGLGTRVARSREQRSADEQDARRQRHADAGTHRHRTASSGGTTRDSCAG